MAGATHKAVVYDRWAKNGRTFLSGAAAPKLGGKDSVLVAVKAASINPVDYKLPAMLLSGRGVGLDLAGVVTAVSADVSSLKVGDRVFGTSVGTLAEQCVCHASEVAKLPESVSFAQGAALTTAYLSAYQALRDNKMGKGMKVLVIGASGGCGSAGVQLAKAMGAGEVTGVCSGRNAELVRSIGADKVIDYTTQKLSDAGAGAFDFCYDTASHSGGGEDYFAAARAVLKDGDAPGQGQYVTLNGSVGLWLRHFTKLQHHKTALLLTQHKTADLEAIAALMVPNGKPVFAPILDQTFPFTAKGVEDAFERLHSRRARGKIIIDMTMAT
jgi:NADPH:quinone reductase-like Zn-dependent oxidoreductase